MSNIKNKDTLYIVTRYNVSDQYDTVTCCAITRTHERALELCGVYRQTMLDAGIICYDFFVQGQIYYDE